MTDEAKKEWRRVMPVLVERRVLSGADLAAVERYCDATGDISIARARIRQDGDYVANRLGELKRHPAFATLREGNGRGSTLGCGAGLDAGQQESCRRA